jgi:hypothetical protein
VQKLDPQRERSRGPNSRRWSDEELGRLRRLAWSMTAAQLAALLGRTPLAVRTKAAHERIRLRSDGGDGW